MEQKNYNTRRGKYKHLNESERYKIEGFLEAKKSPREIAEILGRDRSTIYREIRRGSVSRIQYDLREKMQYRANVGQKKYEEKGRNKERSLKIGKDRQLEKYIRGKILKRWMNNYPRKALGYQSAKQAAKEHLQNNSGFGVDSVAL